MGLRDLLKKTSPSHKASSKAKDGHDSAHRRTASRPNHTTDRDIGPGHLRENKSNTWPIEYGRMSRRDTFEAMGGCGRDSSDSIPEDLRKYLTAHDDEEDDDDEQARLGSASASSAASSNASAKSERPGATPSSFHFGSFKGVAFRGHVGKKDKARCRDYVEGVNGEVKRKVRC